jgi:hypothetical protein
VSLICARGIRTVGFGPAPLFVLSLAGTASTPNECQGKAETCPHSFLLEGSDTFLPNRLLLPGRLIPARWTYLRPCWVQPAHQGAAQ